MSLDCDQKDLACAIGCAAKCEGNIEQKIQVVNVLMDEIEELKGLSCDMEKNAEAIKAKSAHISQIVDNLGRLETLLYQMARWTKETGRKIALPIQESENTIWH